MRALRLAALLLAAVLAAAEPTHPSVPQALAACVFNATTPLPVSIAAVNASSPFIPEYNVSFAVALVPGHEVRRESCGRL